MHEEHVGIEILRSKECHVVHRPGAAMATLLLLGALIPLHALRAWRAAQNRISGSVMATFNAVLIVTAFGLYYLGSETLRTWMSWIHIAAGCLLALWFPVHIVWGRRKLR